MSLPEEQRRPQKQSHGAVVSTEWDATDRNVPSFSMLMALYHIQVCYSEHSNECPASQTHTRRDAESPPYPSILFILVHVIHLVPWAPLIR